MTPAAGAPLLVPPSDVRSEVEIDVDLVRALLRAHHPDLAELPVTAFAEGWDNALFRVGSRWLARLPRRAVAAPLVERERRWLPELAPHLPLRVPLPLREGGPTDRYPWHWTLCEWLDGVPAAASRIAPGPAAEALGAFLARLHGLATPAEPVESSARGVPPGAHSVALLERLHEDWLGALVPVDRLEAMWTALVSAPDFAGPPVWCHGDLHPFNLLVRDDRLSAVLDWGDLHVREPAPDLAAPWLLLPTSAHDTFRTAYGPIDDATWRRAQAWALYFGVMFLAAGHRGSGEAATRVGLVTLERLLASTASL